MRAPFATFLGFVLGASLAVPHLHVASPEWQRNRMVDFVWEAGPPEKAFLRMAFIPEADREYVLVGYMARLSRAERACQGNGACPKPEEWRD